MSKKVKKVKAQKDAGSKKPSNLYYIVLVSAFFVAIFIVAGYVSIQSIAFKQDILSQKNAVNKTLQDNIAAAATLATEIETLEKVNEIESDQALTVLPNTLDFNHIAAMLNNAALRAGVVAESITLSEAVDVEKSPSEINPELKPVIISVNAVGDYEEVKELIRILQSAKQYFNVTDLDISGTRNSLTFRFNVETQFMPSIDTEITTEEVKQ